MPSLSLKMKSILLIQHLQHDWKTVRLPQSFLQLAKKQPFVRYRSSSSSSSSSSSFISAVASAKHIDNKHININININVTSHNIAASRRCQINANANANAIRIQPSIPVPVRAFASSGATQQQDKDKEKYEKRTPSDAPSYEQALPDSIKRRGDEKEVPLLVDADYVYKNLARLVPIDASWYMPAEGRNTYDEFLAKRIIGARFFDIDAIADKNTTLPHMLPSAAQFEQAMHELGIRNSDHLVIYDSSGIFSAPRAYFTFKVFGHERVSILNGGLPAYLSIEDAPLSHGQPTRYIHKHYTVEWHPEYLATLDLIRENLKSQEYLVLDARNAGRFSGTSPEPRPGLKAGHIPKSKNIPYGSLLQTNPKSKHSEFRSAKELNDIFKRQGVSIEDVKAGKQKIITSCGTGVTAAIISFSLEILGAKEHKLYDGSYTEYADPKHNNPIETSAPV
jgi:thiosulfate/3-mercaptopyruvate sulfurtransferase